MLFLNSRMERDFIVDLRVPIDWLAFLSWINRAIITVMLRHVPVLQFNSTIWWISWFSVILSWHSHNRTTSTRAVLAEVYQYYIVIAYFNGNNICTIYWIDFSSFYIFKSIILLKYNLIFIDLIWIKLTNLELWLSINIGM